MKRSIAHLLLLALIAAAGCDTGTGALPDAQLRVDPGPGTDEPDDNGSTTDDTGLVPRCDDVVCEVGVCNPTSGECVGCFEDAHCPHGVCLGEKAYCVQCTADEHCSSGICDGVRRVCVGCGRDADCDDGNPCTIGRCGDGAQCRYDEVEPGDVDHPECFACQSNNDCAEHLYCEKGVGVCGDGEGVCVPRPESCPEVLLRVCGCDKTTYSNQCVAALEGQSVSQDGICPCTSAEDCPGNHVCVTNACPSPDGLTQSGLCMPEATGCDLDPICACGQEWASKCELFNALGFVESAQCAPPDPICTTPFDCLDGQTCQVDVCGDVGLCGPIPESDGLVCDCEGETWPSHKAAALAGAVVASEDACPDQCPVLQCPVAALGAADTDLDGCADACKCQSASDCDGGLCAPITSPTCEDLVTLVTVCVPAVDQTKEMCGCDGATYPNAAAAHKEGVAIKSSGPCP